MRTAPHARPMHAEEAMGSPFAQIGPAWPCARRSLEPDENDAAACAVPSIAQELANLELVTQRVRQFAEQPPAKTGDINVDSASALLLVADWCGALQALHQSLIEHPVMLASYHIERVVARCLIVAYPACCQLLEHTLQHRHPNDLGTWDAAHIHATESVLKQTADCLTAAERWSLLTLPGQPGQHAHTLACRNLRHPLTQALQVSANCWLPPRALRQWLLLHCLRRSLRLPLGPNATQRLLLEVERQAREEKHWNVSWRDPEATLISIEPDETRICFSAGHTLPLDGKLRWILPWRALFAVIHQSGNAEQVTSLLEAWEVLHD